SGYSTGPGSGRSEVDPLPKSQLNFSGGAGSSSGSSTTSARKVTVSGAGPASTSAARATVGARFATTRPMRDVAVRPASSVTVSETTEPSGELERLNTFTGSGSSEPVPSPKSQRYDTTRPPYGASIGSPEPLEEKATFSPRSTLVRSAGSAIVATGSLSATVTTTVVELRRPDGVVTVRVAV